VDAPRRARHIPDRDALVARLTDAEILVIMRERTPFPAALLERLPRLKLLVTSGMRNASIDLAAARARGITVCGTDSSPTPPTELTWALILGLARHLPLEVANLRGGGPWQSTIGADLSGATLGILGLGKIGARVAQAGRAFGMNVVAWSQNLTAGQAEEAGVALAPSKDALFEAADFLTLHLVLSDRSRSIVGEDELRRMRPSAYLVNTSRAGLVDQSALLRALEEGWIAGAGLDVFENEPHVPADLAALDNTVLLPHVGSASEHTRAAMAQLVVDNVVSWFEGRGPLTPVAETPWRPTA